MQQRSKKDSETVNRPGNAETTTTIVHNAMRSTDKSFGNMDINEELRQWAVEQSSENDDEENFEEQEQ